MKTVKFDSFIYSKEAIEQAITAYKKHADITMVVSFEHIVCTIDNCVFDEQTTFNEFCNYVLGCVSV